MHTNKHTYTLPADMTTSAAAPSLMDDELHTCTCIVRDECDGLARGHDDKRRSAVVDGRRIRSRHCAISRLERRFQFRDLVDLHLHA